MTDLLLECHERIRSFSALARRLAAAEAASDEIAEAAERVRRYFSEALPLHVEDEDRSLYPRLHGREPALDAALERMEREHREHESLLAELVSLCGELAATPELHGEMRERLGAVAERTELELRAHLEHEEAIILPAIERLLDAGERAAIVAELRARR